VEIWNNGRISNCKEFVKDFLFYFFEVKRMYVTQLMQMCTTRK
jgi:hypothetical protein